MELHLSSLSLYFSPFLAVGSEFLHLMFGGEEFLHLLCGREDDMRFI